LTRLAGINAGDLARLTVADVEAIEEAGGESAKPAVPVLLAIAEKTDRP